MAGKRRRGGEHDEEHENHERWLVSYADMMTLLMVLFIVLFAISQVDQKKFEALAGGLAKSFGNPIVAIAGGPTAVTPDATIPQPFEPGSSPAAPESLKDPQITAAVARVERVRAEARRKAAEAEVRRLEEARRKMLAALRAKGLEKSVRFRYDERGLVVSIVTDEVLFPNNRAELQPVGHRVLDAVAPVLVKLPNDIAVDGHTNSLPTSGRPYASNWELSVARAVTVLRHLAEVDGVAEERLTATGYADQRPLVPGHGPDATRLNRRVEVVVLSTLPPGDRALLPAVAPVPHES